ncbi:MAG: cupredoxin domain-containing protein [Acidobacteriota bacterium]
MDDLKRALLVYCVALVCGVALVVALAASAAAADDKAERQRVLIETDGMDLRPDEIYVQVERPVRFEIRPGDVPHMFAIPDLEIERIVFPEEPEEVEITFSELRDYEFRCRFHHRMGMKGTIHVVEHLPDESTESPAPDLEPDPPEPDPRKDPS